MKAAVSVLLTHELSSHSPVNGCFRPDRALPGSEPRSELAEEKRLNFRMKLLTHNMLSSHVRGVKGGFPLGIQATEVKVNNVDFNQEFVARMIPKLEWGALVEAAESLGHLSDVPREVISDYENNEEFLRKVHHILLEVEVIEGALKCPESGREFPITKGIPNMLLNDEES